MALARTAQEAGAPLRIVETVIDVNDARKKGMAGRVIAACGGNVAGRTLAVLGVTFKPNTDDMRESPSLDVIPALLAAGARVVAYDPEGMAEARALVDGVVWQDGAYAAIEGADAVIILTEWNEFRALDLDRVKAALRTPLVVDLRNIYEPVEMAELGFRYFCIGRGEAPDMAAAGRKTA
jgi:UDPglucose 6-dehydrogenase